MAGVDQGELQRALGGGGGGGGAENEQKQQEAAARREMILGSVLTGEAKERRTKQRQAHRMDSRSNDCALLALLSSRRCLAPSSSRAAAAMCLTAPCLLCAPSCCLSLLFQSLALRS